MFRNYSEKQRWNYQKTMLWIYQWIAYMVPFKFQTQKKLFFEAWVTSNSIVLLSFHPLDSLLQELWNSTSKFFSSSPCVPKIRSQMNCNPSLVKFQEALQNLRKRQERSSLTWRRSFYKLIKREMRKWLEE